MRELEPMERFSIESLKPELCLYEGCGNMLGIVPLSLGGYPAGQDWTQDRELRYFLQQWGRKINSDSVLVLTGNPHDTDQEYDFYMDVFEPNGSDETEMGFAGGVSTMCGNGIRAVAAYTRTFKPEIAEANIMTRSGLRRIDIDQESDLYSVNMGEFTANPTDLAKYVNLKLVAPNDQGEYINSPIPPEIQEELSKYTSVNTWSIGLNGNRDIQGIDGEPHIIIEVPEQEVESLEKLRELAVAAGPIVTKNLRYFPHEICVNFVSVRGDTQDNVIVWNCTHERNLGDNPDHSVTAACGTGSTVAGAVMFRKGLARSNQYITIKNTGGDLQISIDQETNDIIMKGPANPCPLIDE